MEQEHKRRPRYKGTHPRTFQEKYKEHDPEKYRSDVEKIIESGKTPAGMHIPILVDEILEVLQIQPGQTGYDATLGYGGHTRRMLAQLQGQGHLYATDVDPIEMEKTRARLASAGFGPELLTIQHRNFADVDQVAPGVLFDFVLADLGVSSMQIDDRPGALPSSRTVPWTCGWTPPPASPRRSGCGSWTRRSWRTCWRKIPTSPTRTASQRPSFRCSAGAALWIPPASCTPSLRGRCLSSPPGSGRRR